VARERESRDRGDRKMGVAMRKGWRIYIYIYIYILYNYLYIYLYPYPYPYPYLYLYLSIYMRAVGDLTGAGVGGAEGGGDIRY
jgi:hypothetical protein